MELLYKIWRKFAVWFSNIHWSFAFKSCPLNNTDYVQIGESKTNYVKRMSTKIMDAFEYKHDGFDELGDTIPPPAEAYYQFLRGELVDDCDGFHAALYHAAMSNGIECKLIEIFSTKNFFGHCVFLFKDETWKICDYTHIMDLDEAYEYYKEKTNNSFVVYEVVWENNKYHTKAIDLFESVTKQD